MNARTFLEDLHSRGVSVWTDGKILSYDAPPGVMTPQLEGEIVLWNKQLIELLSHGPDTPSRAPSSRSLPLSFAQERLWFLEQLEPGMPVYNIPWAVRLSGDLKTAALQETLNRLIDRHEVLRTTYVATDGVPTQVINPPSPVAMTIVDLRHLQTQECETTAQQHLNEEAQRPFDLTSDGMLRALLIRLTDDEYLLLLVIHHIAFDGWSTDILVRELSHLYRAFSRGEDPDLPPLPMQYADYAIWQREHLTGEVLERELGYWKEQLADLPPALNLPFDRPRNSRPDYRGERVAIEVPDQVTQGLRGLAHEENVTPFMLMLTAFMTLLYRYTGEEDIPVGAPIAGRVRSDTEGLIGLFVNTLVLRGDLSQEPTFRELLSRVRNVCLDAYDHQEIPFEKLVAALHPERNSTQSPLFQIMFSMQTQNDRPTKLADLSMEHHPVRRETTKFDLSMSLTETPTNISGSMTFPIALFDTEGMTRMSGNFNRLLKTIVANPDQAITTMPVLTDEEYRIVVDDWNSSTVPFPREATIDQLIEQQAKENPTLTSVICDGQELTYRELSERSALLANHLRSLGSDGRSVIGIAMTRSIDLIVAIVGILKSGAAYLPLDPHYPTARLRYMIEDADTQIVVTDQATFSRLPLEGKQIVTLDADWPMIANDEPAWLPSEATSDGIAYIMYTSGSTGQPKGVMVSHKNVVGFLYAYREVVALSQRRIGTNVISYSFDTSIDEIFSPLCFGGTLHVVPYEATLDGRSLAKYIIDHRINTAYVVPDILPDVASVFDAQRSVGDLLYLITGLTPKKQCLLQRFRDLSPMLHIVNAYGPTEVTYGATAFEFMTAVDAEADVPIGRPFPNYQVYITNCEIQPVPIGAIGEIMIGGVGVSQGYLDRPQLTADRFVPNPFRPDLSPLLYRTGDLGRYREDGTIEFLGRTDAQVKIRGFRIELREIELTLSTHPGIANSYVTKRGSASGDEELIAFATFLNDSPPGVSELRRFLGERLPRYMIPSGFVFLNEFPLTPSGKLDTQALPEPDRNRPSLDEGFVEPQTAAEKLIARVWSDVLKIDRVGVNDDFFALGGHSLAAVRVIIRLRDETDANLTVRAVFEFPTVQALATHLVEATS